MLMLLRFFRKENKSFTLYLRLYLIRLVFLCKIIPRYLRFAKPSSDNVPDLPPLRLNNLLVKPFLHLLQPRVTGGTYCGGPEMPDPSTQLQIRHYRGSKAVDAPCSEIFSHYFGSCSIEKKRLFWCGPLVSHFGHQVADFSSRILFSSLDPREGELLLLPWKCSSNFEQLEEWQRYLLWYLNPSNKNIFISDHKLYARNLIVWPQQAPMWRAPSNLYLEMLSFRENCISIIEDFDVVYVSRSRFSLSVDRKSLNGAFAGERILEELLCERGVKIIHPELISLERQLSIYRSARVLIFAEGSSQHCLELLGPSLQKDVYIICRRNQDHGMKAPLFSRFPRVQFIEAVESFWVLEGNAVWNGLAVLNWCKVIQCLNKVIPSPITPCEIKRLESASENQLALISKLGRLRRVDS